MLTLLNDRRRQLLPFSSEKGTKVGIAEEKPQDALRIRLLGGFRVSVGPRTVGEDGWRLKKA